MYINIVDIRRLFRMESKEDFVRIEGKREDFASLIDSVASRLSDELNICRINGVDIGGFSPSIMPSVKVLEEFMILTRSVLFPEYFRPPEIAPKSLKYYIGATLDRMSQLLEEQVSRGLESAKFMAAQTFDKDLSPAAIVSKFLDKLPVIKSLLILDVEAAYYGDPAAKSKCEVIYCYPSIKALIHYRVAHELSLLGVPLISRILTEMAHSITGIDIHPGAEIGERFFMDHGTGIVIGETSIIGKNVRIYQGVTLGAKSFPAGEDGNPMKGIPRHPIVEDDVIIYSGATILGRVRIGRGAIIGSNVWITEDVAPGTKVTFSKTQEQFFYNGGGI
jgi:serine O-acetyltransferase